MTPWNISAFFITKNRTINIFNQNREPILETLEIIQKTLSLHSVSLEPLSVPKTVSQVFSRKTGPVRDRWINTQTD